MTWLRKYKLLLIGIMLGVVYGLVTRVVFDEAIASITYLVVIPLVLGMISLVFADQQQLRSYRNIIFVPWVTALGFFIVSIAGGLEGLGCLIILGAPFFLFGTLGAFLYRLYVINKNKKARVVTLVLLPFLLAPLEGCFRDPSDTFTVASEVVVEASPQIIWENIVAVDTIRDNEYTPGFFNYAGIPRPISATVDSQAPGGRRVGHFEGGLRFEESITRFDPYHTVAFSIAVDPSSVRSNVFDQHVLNGHYFAFVNAAYTLTDLGHGRVKLTLTSAYRLTSKVNFYGKFWGDLILEDFQSRLLTVIARRCSQPELPGIAGD